MKRQTLVNIWRELNETVYFGVLAEPVILCKRWRDAHAQHYVGVIEFNPEGIKGIDHARAVVYHEMTHQYVEEFLGVSEENDHGPIFWRNYKLFAPKGVELGECL